MFNELKLTNLKNLSRSRKVTAPPSLVLNKGTTPSESWRARAAVLYVSPPCTSCRVVQAHAF